MKKLDKSLDLWYNEYIKRRKGMINNEEHSEEPDQCRFGCHLVQARPNAPADIFVDVRVWNTAFKYPDADMDSGICYSSDDDTVFLNFGEF